MPLWSGNEQLVPQLPILQGEWLDLGYVVGNCSTSQEQVYRVPGNQARPDSVVRAVQWVDAEMSSVTPRLFSGPGRRYWGTWGTSCWLCWDGYRCLILDTPEMDDFFKRAANCKECAGTQRDPIPWAELFSGEKRK